MAHVGLAGRKGLAPDRLAAAPDARLALDPGGRSAEQQLGPEGAGPELGVRQVEVIALLQQVVGELVAEREADPPWPAGMIDQDWKSTSLNSSPSRASRM